jgi:hypothetical protein
VCLILPPNGEHLENQIQTHLCAKTDHHSDFTTLSDCPSPTTIRTMDRKYYYLPRIQEMSGPQKKLPPSSRSSMEVHEEDAEEQVDELEEEDTEDVELGEEEFGADESEDLPDEDEDSKSSHQPFESLPDLLTFLNSDTISFVVRGLLRFGNQLRRETESASDSLRIDTHAHPARVCRINWWSCSAHVECRSFRSVCGLFFVDSRSLLLQYLKSSPELTELFAILASADKNYAVLWRLTDVFALIISQAHGSRYHTTCISACQKVRVDFGPLMGCAEFYAFVVQRCTGNCVFVYPL